MIVRSMDDLRTALDRMAKHNRLSLTALNEVAQIGQGILTRLRRKDVKTRSGPGSPIRDIQADIKFSTLIRVVESAGWEMEFRPKEQGNRRTRVREAARAQGGVGDTTTPVVADVDS